MPSKRDDIRRLLVLSGNQMKAVAMTEDMLSKLRGDFDAYDLPEEFWDDLRTEMLDFSGLEDTLVEIYDRLLSHETVLWAIRLYESPEGKAFFGVMADILHESLKAGVTRGERITSAVMARHGLLPN